MKKLVVILTGGGAKGAFQVGAWNKILQEGLNFEGKKQKIKIPHAVFGVSAGALNGAMIAMGKNTELVKLWNSIAGKPQEIFRSDFLTTQDGKTSLDTKAVEKFLISDLTLLQKIGLLFKNSRSRTVQTLLNKLKSVPALASNDPLLKKIQQLIHIKDIKSENFQTGAVSLTNGKYYSMKHTDFSSDSDLQNAVLASSTIPLLWSAVESVNTAGFEISDLVDGGIRNINPIGDAVNYINQKNDNHEYYFLIISCHTKSIEIMEQPTDLLTVLKRSIYDIAFNEIGDTDLNEFLRINELVKQAESKGIDLYSNSGRKLKTFHIKIIQPLRQLGSALNFSRSMVMDSYLHGYEVAKGVIESPNWD